MLFFMAEKKKVDYAALESPFMRIPRMNVRAARALLDLGFKEVYQLRGRDPDSIFSDLKKIKKNPSADILNFIKIAVDFAESGDNL